MNRVAAILGTASVRLERFDHPPGHSHCDPERECAAGHAVSFVETGAFRVRTTGAWRPVAAGELFLTHPGLEFSCAHDEEQPTDCCLSISYDAQAIESLRGAGLAPPTALVEAPSNRRAYLHHALSRCGHGDEARVDALAGALQWTLGTPPSVTPLFPAHRLHWYADRVDRAVSLIEQHFADPLSLSTMARDAGMSVFHFARVFNELQGLPPHRYLTSVRLARARERLRAGASVTDTCFAVGFGSLSHFVTSYRRRFGVTPSATRMS
jgi:AraC-like DNA-binding protein